MTPRTIQRDASSRSVLRPLKGPLRSAPLVAAVSAALLAGCGGGGGHARSSAPAPNASAAGLQQQFVAAVSRVSPSVVQVERSGGLGSGIVFDKAGDIVTNNHVVGNAKAFRVTFSDGSRADGKLVGTFPPDDLAVIRASAPKLHPAIFADSSKLKVGDFALAVGNPLGLRSSVTQGIVSSLGRTVGEGNGVTLPSAIQTSAAINPGNSGGALVDLSSEVIGIPTLAALDPQLGGAQAPGIGFAISSNTVRDIANQLVKHGRVVSSGRAYLGVSVATLQGGGVLVRSVVANGPAATAGIKPGEVISAVNGKPTQTADVLQQVLAPLTPGQTVKLEVAPPAGSPATVTVKLGQLPGS